MNQEQILAFLRQMVIGLGSSFVTKGIMTDSQLEILAGAIAALAAIGWGQYVRRNAGLVKSAANVSGMHEALVDRKLADAVNHPKVVAPQAS